MKDYKALKSLDGRLMGKIEEAWEIARKLRGRGLLTAEEKTEIANSVIQGYGPVKPGGYGAPNARERRIDKLTAEQVEFYVDPIEAAFRYVDGAIYAAERSRFLGKNHGLDKMDETIGKIVQEQVDAGKLNEDQQEELVHLLRTRFTADLLSMHRYLRNFKQLTYMLTLSNVGSTVAQLTDVAMTAAEHGIPASVKGLKGVLRLGPADRRLVMEDIGQHAYGEEFKDVGPLARRTDQVLTATGFKMMDRFGKEHRINTARDVIANAAKDTTSAAFKRLARDYRPVLGDEAFDQVMEDLRAGRDSMDVRYLVFLDLTKVQPVTTSQMPVRYLQNPNGRILYALKTFTLMRLDHLRRQMARNPTQCPAGSVGTDREMEKSRKSNRPDLPGDTDAYKSLSDKGIAATGLEPVTRGL